MTSPAGVRSVSAVQITFTKLRDGRACRWSALRPPRTKVPGPTMAVGRDLPHDLATFVIEEALSMEYGFWGCVAAGATFRSLGRRRTQQGTGVIVSHRDELDACEARVNEIYFAWRAGRTTPVDEALDATLVEWRALPDGGELERRWQRPPGSRLRPSNERSRTARRR